MRLRRRGRRELQAARFRLLHTLTAARTTLRWSGVALTFDDGPQPGCTDVVLDLLAVLDVRATFFCVGRNAERFPALVRRMADEGHAVGSHSLTHPHPRDLTPSRLRWEYAAGRSAVEQALGSSAPLFRPPHGHLSLRTVHVLRPHRPVLWSVDPEDWRAGAQREQIGRVAGAAAGGDVVLLHDWVEQPEGPQALDRRATFEALPVLVESVRSRGLSFVALVP